MKFFRFLVLIGLIALFAGCTSDNSEKTETSVKENDDSGEKTTKELKFSMAVGESSPWTQSAYLFADLVEEKSNGEIKIKVYPDGQLAGGDSITELELLQNGSIDITFHSSIILSTIDERFIAFSMPWIASSFEELERIMDGPGKEIWNDLDDKGIVPLGGYSSSGFRQITNSKHPINSPEDLKGMKLRVPSISMYTSIYRTLGADPTTISIGELFVALQQGTVDGQENPLSLISASGYDEVQKYLSLWNYSADVIGILMNKDLWEGFDEESQSILQEAAEEAAMEHRQMQIKADEISLEEMSKVLEINELSEEQIQAFRDAMQPVYEEYEEIISKDILDKFLSSTNSD